MIKGSCLCQAVRFAIDGPIGALIYCHCSQCRKAQGTAFAANVPVSREDYRILSGAEFVASFRSSENKTRYFCQRCGSALYSHVTGGETYRIRAGLLDDRVELSPSAHIFATSRAPWCDISDPLPQYEKQEPGRR